MRYWLAILLAISAAYALLRGVQWRTLPRWEKALVIIFIMSAVVGGYFTAQDVESTNRDSRIRATFGELVTKYTDREDVELIVSGTGVRIVGANTVSFGDEQAEFEVAKIDGKLYAYAIIPDENGTPIAKVDGYYWQIFSNGYDYNNDEYAFEIISPDGRVVFQIDLVCNIANFAGLVKTKRPNHCWYFCDALGYAIERRDTVFINDVRKRGGGATGQSITNGLIFGGEPFVLPKNVIKPIFKYPRQKFVNERLNERPEFTCK